MTGAPKWGMYIDGFNFYYSIKKGLPRNQLHLAWCDFSRLAREIIGDRGVLSRIKYFTAPVDEFARGAIEKKRQEFWLRAMESIPSLEVVRGFYNGPYSTDPSLRYRSRREKETDVNIALEMGFDAVEQVYDSAILVTHDYVQMPTVRKVTKKFMRPVEVWLPPGDEITERWERFARLERVTVDRITEEMLERSKLPDTIHDSRGAIEAPAIWRAPRKSVIRRLRKRPI